MDKILRNGKALFLAYDHGMEHGPVEFEKAHEAGDHEFTDSLDPQFILDLAHRGGYTAVVLQKGLAQDYYDVWGADERREVPLIIKLNGRTNVPEIEPFSPLICTVPEAVELGASAVGYTVYVGSEREAEMLEIFGGIVEDAHSAGIPVIGWMYPRGKWVTEKYGKDTNPEIVAYGARVALEVGADMAKIKYTGDVESFTRVVKSAGRTKVVLSGGEKTEKPEDFLQVVKDVMAVGATGVAVGRNVWKSKDPLKVTEEIKKIIFA